MSRWPHLYAAPVQERARRLASEAHERIFQAVITNQRPLVPAISEELATCRADWPTQHDDDTADLAVTFACRTVALQDRIAEARGQ
jgi:hypothetical protein